MYDIFEQLLQKYGVTTYQVAKATGISQSTFSSWKARRNVLSGEKAKKIADYFGVTIDYLMTGKEETEKESGLTAKDERDIEKTVNELMDKLSSNDGAPLYFDGEEMDDQTRVLFKAQLKSLVTTVKEINKEKYNPNKNKR